MQSPLKLFRSLKHGDPQAVAYTAVFIFLASVFWFSYTFLFPAKSHALPLGGGRTGNVVMDETLSLGEILEVHRVFLTPEDVPNPFYREPPGERPSNQQNKNPKGKGDDKGNGNPQPAPNNTLPQNAPPPQPPVNVAPEMRSLTLTYRGLLTRPDHTTVALVEILEDSSRVFIRVGESIPPFTVNSISPEGLQIQEEKGPAIFLPRGAPKEFKVPL